MRMVWDFKNKLVLPNKVVEIELNIKLGIWIINVWRPCNLSLPVRNWFLTIMCMPLPSQRGGTGLLLTIWTKFCFNNWFERSYEYFHRKMVQPDPLAVHHFWWLAKGAQVQIYKNVMQRTCLLVKIYNTSPYL